MCHWESQPDTVVLALACEICPIRLHFKMLSRDSSPRNICLRRDRRTPRSLALPKEVAHWSLTTLREKLVKIGAKVVRHGRYVTFQLAEVAVLRDLFRKFLSLIDDL